MITNLNSVFATYTSGMFNGFYKTEYEAIAHCKNEDNGTEFNGTWFQDRYTEFKPGSLALDTRNNIVSFTTGKNENVGHIDDFSFVIWYEKSPLTDHEIATLNVVKTLLGRTWKSQLLKAWENV